VPTAAPLTSRQVKLRDQLVAAADELAAARAAWERAVWRAVQGGLSTRTTAAAARCSHQQVTIVHRALSQS
jgi:hypothetical protein